MCLCHCCRKQCLRHIGPRGNTQWHEKAELCFLDGPFGAFSSQALEQSHVLTNGPGMGRSIVSLDVCSSPAICMTASIPLVTELQAKEGGRLSQRASPTGCCTWNDRWYNSGKPSISRCWSIHVIIRATASSSLCPRRFPRARSGLWSMSLQHVTVCNGPHPSERGCCCSGKRSF